MVKLFINIVTLEALMKAKGYTYSSLERAADMGNGVARGWNEKNPSLPNLVKVADLLECSVDDLLNRDRRAIR